MQSTRAGLSSGHEVECDRPERRACFTDEAGASARPVPAGSQLLQLKKPNDRRSGRPQELAQKGLFRREDGARQIDEGFTVFEAANADAALVLLHAEPSINLLLTDIDMPGSMDGLKLAAAVRNRWPPVKIIVASGQVRHSPSDLPEGGRFFAKPYLGSALAAAFRDMAA